jgi:hypothetical protein
MWRPDVTMLICRGWRGDMCHSKTGAESMSKMLEMSAMCQR